MIDPDGSREPMDVTSDGDVQPQAKRDDRALIESMYDCGTPVMSVGLIPDDPVDDIEDSDDSEWDEPATPKPEEKVAALEEALRRANFERIRSDLNRSKLRESREVIRYWTKEVVRLHDDLIAAQRSLEEAREFHFALEEKQDTGQDQPDYPFGVTAGSAKGGKPSRGVAAGWDTQGIGQNQESGECRILRSLPTDEDKGWEVYSVANLDLTKGIDKALASAGVRTLGDIANYVKSGKILTEIPEIGRAKADRIASKLIDFWRARQERLDAGKVQRDLDRPHFRPADTQEDSEVMVFDGSDRDEQRRKDIEYAIGVLSRRRSEIETKLDEQEKAMYAEDIAAVESATPEDPIEEQADLSHGNKIVFDGEGSLVMQPKDEEIF